MTNGIQKLIEAVNGLKESVNKYQSLAVQIESLEDRICKLEEEAKKYRSFVDKTSGFFTRIGFYGDAAVLWLRTKFKK